jgi:Fic family protein
MTRAPCIPDSLPLDNLDWKRLAAYTNKAMLALARYDGTLDGMVNAAVLLSPVTSQEAVLSSRIEGTQVSLTEVLKHEAGEKYSEAKGGEIREVLNYRRALLMAEQALQEHPELDREEGHAHQRGALRSPFPAGDGRRAR